MRVEEVGSNRKRTGRPQKRGQGRKMMDYSKKTIMYLQQTSNGKKR
jgi:hypothetical protein